MIDNIQTRETKKLNEDRGRDTEKENKRKI